MYSRKPKLDERRSIPQCLDWVRTHTVCMQVSKVPIQYHHSNEEYINYIYPHIQPTHMHTTYVAMPTFHKILRGPHKHFQLHHCLHGTCTAPDTFCGTAYMREVGQRLLPPKLSFFQSIIPGNWYTSWLNEDHCILLAHLLLRLLFSSSY